MGGGASGEELVLALSIRSEEIYSVGAGVGVKEYDVVAVEYRLWSCCKAIKELSGRIGNVSGRTNNPALASGILGWWRNDVVKLSHFSVWGGSRTDPVPEYSA